MVETQGEAGWEEVEEEDGRDEWGELSCESTGLLFPRRDSGMGGEAGREEQGEEEEVGEEREGEDEGDDDDGVEPNHDDDDDYESEEVLEE